MNKTIKDLADLAELNLELQSLKVDQFAKSIVKETIHQLGSQLWHYGIDESNNPSFYKAIEKTEEHFGIVNELRLD
jgi:hypothetical protein